MSHLLVVGVYLVDIGFVTLALKTAMILEPTQDLVERLSTKIGIVLLVLGALHFCNLLAVSRIRRRTLGGENPPPQPKPALPARQTAEAPSA